MGIIPKFDNRDFNKLMVGVKKLAKQYTPEWNFDEKSSDFGVIFAKVFCDMMQGTISKYNKTVYNYYLTFLNTLGIKVRPATPSRGMIIAKASLSDKGAYIPKKSRLYAEADTDDGTVVYETTDSLFAINTFIRNIIFTDSDLDMISYIHPDANGTAEESDEEIPIEPFIIFDNVSYKNEQLHEIYLGDEVNFYMQNSDITLEFYNDSSKSIEQALPDIFYDKNNVLWQYYYDNKWHDIKDITRVEHGIRLKFDKCTQVSKVLGQQSRFLRCKFNKLLNNQMVVTNIKYKTESEILSPQTMSSDDENIDKTDFYPFHEKYGLYSTFSFSSEEAFTKTGATIEIEAKIQFVKIYNDTDPNNQIRKYKNIMTDLDFADLEPSDKLIEKVIWEYWNGTGWAKLDVNKDGEDFFKFEKGKDIVRKVKFVCPKIEENSIAAGIGHFIRIRVAKVINEVAYMANYITPYIHSISIKYANDSRGYDVDNVIVFSDLKQYNVNFSDRSPKRLMERSLCEYPSMYFCLSNPLSEGTLRLFIDIEEGVHRYNSSINWEYLSDDYVGGSKWRHIDVMDMTSNFSHSGTVTMIGRKDFKKAVLFGKEGYFLRITNPDKAYARTNNLKIRPKINDIKFNAVEVIQKDAHSPEFFSIAKDEQNKMCRLSSSGVTDVDVWIDEYGSLSTNEQEYFLSNKSICEPEYDDLGQLQKMWIKWKPIAKLINADMTDRVYEIDYSKGEILFGDGRYGKIPTEQYNESIRVHYSICNGTKGNIDAHAIQDFLSSIDGLDSIDNPSPIMGGVDMETIDMAASRTFSQISGVNRLVTLADFEDSIKANDKNIYKIKCVSHVDEDSKKCIGVTSIAILPRKYMQGFEKFQGIKNNIWKFIDEKGSAIFHKTSKVRIFEVKYVETSVGLDVVISDFNDYQGVYNGIRDKLKDFLDPIQGNFSHTGWNIGEFPKKEIIYNYIKVVENIKFIKKINVFTKVVTEEGKQEVNFENIKDEYFIVPVFGEPIINISVE